MNFETRPYVMQPAPHANSAACVRRRKRAQCNLHNALINMVFSEIGNIRNMQIAKKDAAISIRGSVTRQTRPKPNLHPLGMESHKFRPNL